MINKESDFKIIKQGGENAALFDTSDIINAQTIGNFEISDGGCVCIKPKNNKINLIIENLRNTVFISENK